MNFQISDRPSDIIIDMSGVSFIDASAAEQISSSSKEIWDLVGARLCLANSPSKTYTILFTKIFTSIFKFSANVLQVLKREKSVESNKTHLFSSIEDAVSFLNYDPFDALN